MVVANNGSHLPAGRISGAGADGLEKHREGRGILDHAFDACDEPVVFLRLRFTTIAHHARSIQS